MPKFEHFPAIAFSALVIRTIIFGAGIGEAVAFFAIAGLFGFFHFLESKKEAPINEAVLAEVRQLRDSVNALKIGKTFQK